MDEFTKRWSFVRGETFDILSVLSADQMRFVPEGEKWQPMYAHFSCMAKTQQVYTHALTEGKMDFAYFHTLELPDKSEFADKQFASDYLTESNRLWLAALQGADTVTWPSHQIISPQDHVMRLAEHERLHHGQLISYFTIAKIELPQSFKQNWAL